MFYDLSLLEDEPPVLWPPAKTYVEAKRLPGGTPVRIPVLPYNILITGVTRYGKTYFAKKWISSLLRANPEQKAVFFQIKPSDFTDIFLAPEDKVICYSRDLFPDQLFRWNLVNEVRQSDDPEAELEDLSSVFFGDLLQDSHNLIWSSSAKDVFKAYVKAVLFSGELPSNRALIDGIQCKNRKQLLGFLAQYSPNRPILSNYFEYDPDHCENYRLPRRGGDILFFLQNVLSKFSGASFCPDSGTDTLHDYLTGSYGKHLFMIHDQAKRDSCSLFEQYAMKKIGNSVMSQAAHRFQGNMLWVLDEIDKIGGDIGLTEAATLGQQFGLTIVLSTQSLESLYAVAPARSEHLTRAAMAGFPLLAAFHPGDPHTIECLQQLFGNERRSIVTLPVSRYDSPDIKTELEPIVDDQNLSSLGVGQCYIKLRDSRVERVQIC